MRPLTVAAAQLGPIALEAPRSATVSRLVGLMATAKSRGADLIVAPRYEVNVEDYFVYKTVNVKVTGKKGTVTAIR